MKKILLLLIFNSLYAQIDTINISQFTTTQLILEDKIKFIDIGTGDLFIKNKIINNILILQSVVHEEDFLNTNLFLQLENENYYNFYLKFEDEKNKKYTYSFKHAKDRKENNVTIPLTEQEHSVLTKLRKVNKKFRPSSSYNLKCSLEFMGHFYTNNEVYYKFKLANKSQLNYTVGDFYFSIRKNKKRNSAHGERIIEPLKLLTPISKIKGKERHVFIFKFHSFSINKEEEIFMELKEGAHGNRDFTLGIPYYVVNNPYKI